MKLKLPAFFILLLLSAIQASADKLFIPMGATGQANHLKAYGIVYTTIQKGIAVEWLLNYQGGSFVTDDNMATEQLCTQRGVSYTRITDKQYAKIIKETTDPSFNGAVVKLEKAPRIAVYTPPGKMPWDDAVTLALTYAQIPFDKIYATEVLAGDLDKYDWLHLHHEDFTGQYSRYGVTFRDSLWYQQDKRKMEQMATKNGYKKVSKMQLAVVRKMRDFVAGGGNLFAMCSATETFDVAISAEHTDICDTMYDGDPVADDAQAKLDYSKCFAFRNFQVNTKWYQPGHSNISNTYLRGVAQDLDFFTIVSPPANLDLVPVMLCQNHTRQIPGFLGLTTSFSKALVKPNVMVLGERVENNEARYIHGEYGKGSWTFLGGHDPEDYAHRIHDPATDLSLHPNSPGYRLILNNVLFPSVKKTYVPTVELNNTVAKGNTAAADNKATENNIHMYADPTKNELVVTITTGKIEQVVIMDFSGKEVVNRKFKDQKVNIDIHGLTSGMYMVTVNDAYIGRIVKN